MSRTLESQPCPTCHSKDNLKTWEYEGRIITQCKTPNCIGIKNKEFYASRPLNGSFPDPNNTQQEFIVGEFKETRGLTVETCRKYGIMLQEDRHIFQYKNSQKLRIPVQGDKKFYWNNYNKDAGFFAEDDKDDFEKDIIITEGEFDAASLRQSGYQAVSVNSGAGSAYQEIEKEIEKYSRYARISLWFDSDKAGQEGLRNVLNIPNFPLYRTNIIKSEEYKDANEVLMKAPDKLHEIILSAIEYVPEGLISGDQVDFSKLDIPEEPGYPFPFEIMQNCFHGLRKSEILLVGAGSGTGKSLFVKILDLYWMLHVPNIKIANIFLEETEKFTIQSLMALKLKIPAFKLLENPPKGLGQMAKEFLGKKNFIFDSHFGSLESKELFKKLRYLAKKVDVIILDHISIIVSGLMSVEGERKDLDRLMTMLKTLAMETGVRFVIISHLRRPDGEKSYELGLPVTPNSFRSSGSMYQLSNSVISLERNQQSPTEKNKVLVRGLKNRYKGDAGILDILYHNSDTGLWTTLDQIFDQ